MVGTKDFSLTRQPKLFEHPLLTMGSLQAHQQMGQRKGLRMSIEVPIKDACSESIQFHWQVWG